MPVNNRLFLRNIFPYSKTIISVLFDFLLTLYPGLELVDLRSS